ncbi:MAG: ATP-binding cassette domain-containing protein [Pseudomonadota bacterium]
MSQAAAPPALRLRGLRFAWPGGAFALEVDGFELTAGEALFLAGPSGSGKSTLLSLICGIVRPQAGEAQLFGEDLATLGQARRDRLRAERIGVIFQMFNLVPYLSGLENVLLPLRFAPGRRAACADPRAEALALTEALGLPRATVERGAAGALSVGQQQRIAVARAMIGGPPLIVADEPTSALDAAAQADFMDLLFDRARAAGAALLMVSHDRRLADRFDRTEELTDIARTRRADAA